MASAEKLLYVEADGSLGFGDYTLAEKAKVEDFPYQGDLLKVKTYHTMTKLEKNGMFVYESVPGTSVSSFSVKNTEVTFTVSGTKDAQITIQLEDDMDYEVFTDGITVGGMKTNMSGKLSLSVELSEGKTVDVKVVRK